SQKELSEISGVPLRTIQQYEQGQKNINSAKAETVLKLAKVLECSAEDLMEID
ncbi:helix-turn-helix domain-containing protein, partial [uncultured Treponema sp.]